MLYTDSSTPKKKRASFTIREDILRDARELGINASQEAEKGIKAAVRQAKKEQWIEENRSAIDAHNKRIERDGLHIKSYWLEELEEEYGAI